MPKGTKVERIYNALKNKKGKASAARIAQAVSGVSLKTGKKPKAKTTENKKEKIGDYIKKKTKESINLILHNGVNDDLL